MSLECLSSKNSHTVKRGSLMVRSWFLRATPWWRCYVYPSGFRLAGISSGPDTLSWWTHRHWYLTFVIDFIQIKHQKETNQTSFSVRIKKQGCNKEIFWEPSRIPFYGYEDPPSRSRLGLRLRWWNSQPLELLPPRLAALQPALVIPQQESPSWLDYSGWTWRASSLPPGTGPQHRDACRIGWTARCSPPPRTSCQCSASLSPAGRANSQVG